MSHIEIQTTQNIRLEYEMASVGERLVAAILDRLLWFFWFAMWGFLAGGLGLEFSVVLFIIVCAPVLFYYLYCELLFNGQSVGKLIMNIRVAKLDGTAPSFGDYFLRWIFRLIDNAAVAIICMMFTPKSQRLGDLAARTCMIRTKSHAKLTNVPELNPDYVVTFDSAMHLSDTDVALIAQIISNPATIRNQAGLRQLTNKVKEITRTQADMSDLIYLRKILSDYNYLAGKL